MNLTIPQPFPYQGSKRKLAPLILPYMPSRFARLIEPFAGSAAISVAVAWHRNTKQFWLNDAHKPIIDLWRYIIQSPSELADFYEQLWEEQDGKERDFYNSVRTRFNDTHDARLFLFLLARCVKAAIRYNRLGKFNNSPDHRRKGMRPVTMRKNLMWISEVMGADVKLTSADYTEVLSMANQNDIVYMDPPYQGVCSTRDSRYVKDVIFDDFVGELDKLNSRNIAYIISYDGRCGDTAYGEILPDELGLFHTELKAGKSTQATLLGRNATTYESLYVSPALAKKLDVPLQQINTLQDVPQPTLF